MHNKGRWLQGAKKGGVEGSEGRQETDWDSWTNPLGSLALSQSGDLETLLDMLDVEVGALDDESGLDLVLIVSYMWSLLPDYSKGDFLLLWRRNQGFCYWLFSNKQLGIYTLQYFGKLPVVV